MNILPSNIRCYIQKYKNKMKGNQNAILKIEQCINEFNQSRKESNVLRKIEISPLLGQKNLVNNQLYLIKMEGRKNTYYQGRILTFYLLVFDTYPEDPPQIIAPFYCDEQLKVQRPFLHLNIDQNGQVCMLSNQKDKQYYHYTTLKDILIQLQNMVYSPNISSSYPSELFTCYKEKGDNSLYFQKLNLQAKFLQEKEKEQSQSSESQINDQ